MSIENSEPEIDFQHLRQYVGDDIELTKEIFGLFKHQVDMWGRGLIVDADDESWKTVMHSLKGTANAVGALQLAALCKKGEGLAGLNNKPGLREKHIQDVRFRIDRAILDIQRWEYRQTLAGLRS